MFSLLKKSTLKTEVASDSPLEDILSELQRYGQPRLGMYGSGWCCSVDMRVDATGAKFEIKSEHGLPSPRAAAFECLSRVRSAMDKLKG